MSNREEILVLYKQLEQERNALYKILDTIPMYLEDTEARYRGFFNYRDPEINLEYSAYSSRLDEVITEMRRIRENYWKS